MNYGLLSNPQKELTLNFPFQTVRDAILKIPVNHKIDYKMERDDLVLNVIRFTCRWGFTWNGFASFTLTSINETSTKLVVEAGDGKRGSINSNIEANNANGDIKTLLNYVSDYLSNNVDEKGISKSAINTGSGCVLFIAIPFITLLYHWLS